MKKLTAFLSLVLALVMLISPAEGLFAVQASAAGEWVCSWATSMVDPSVSLASLSLQDVIPSRTTIRIELKVTTGGEKLRFRFSNEYGSAPIKINEATVAKTVGSGNASVKPETSALITFDGENSVTIPAGQTLWSDSVDFPTQALDAISVSLYFGSLTYITTAGLSNARTFMAVHSLLGGSSECYKDRITSPREVNIASGAITYHTTPFLSEIEAYSSEDKDVAVFIGDSTLVNDTYYYFAEKLVKAGITNISVVNQAVVANKLLSDGTGLIGNLYGKAMLDRFKRDALSIKGVKYIFVKIGLNDILHQFSKSMGADVPHPTAEDIIEGYKTLVKQAHAQGVKIYFFTKSPWKGYEREFLGQKGDITWTKEMQDMCDELNRWITTNKAADGYIDCSPLANPADEYALCPSFTPDGAHLTSIASIALADLVPVSFVGVNKEIKTAAKINKVDPYEEKKQIIYDMEHPTETPTEKPTEKPTERPAESTTARPEESTTGSSAVTTEPSSTQGYVPQEIITVPVIADTNVTERYQGTGSVKPNYNISEDIPEQLGNGTPLAFLLVAFLVVTVSGAVVFITLGRKKEEELQ